ncbi:protein timeless homolog [Liolophura sinensis]|uniref:protein timeless homolog n=1 Tax=Liolophura sinensis TaxID=3198878 RepID=UPI00315976FF
MVMHVELQATCSALGYQEGDKYVKEPDCLETVKDLIRFLKREDETCDIRQQLGQAQIVQNDLIPLVKHYKKDRALQECVIRLMVNLTQPSILCFNNHLPDDKTIRNHYLEVEFHLQGYKEAFVDEELFAVLTEKMGDMLKLDWENRHEEDKMFIERLLILVRNILHVPPNPQQEKRTDDDASIHDQVLWALHVSGMEDLLLYIASSDDERQYCVHVLEIISLMFREQTPELLAHAGVQRSLTEKEKDQRELELARQKEKAAKLANVMKHSSRHSRFGGTFVMKNMKSISDKDMIYHKPLGDTNNISFDQNKKPKKQPKNRQAIKDVELVRRSTLSIRLALKDFCVQFLENCYNPLMRAVKDSLVREHTQEHDETYYMWAMRFFMEFCRVHSGKVELVSETMSVPTFHYIYTNLLNYYEMIMTEKKEGKTWSRRVHLALKAYQELLLTLYSMDKSSRSQIRESSKVIKGNVFYMMEFRDIFLTLLRKFDESKQSRSYLKDLVETTHLFIKMLEAFCKQTSHLVVQKKSKKARQKRKKGNEEQTENEVNPELEDLWDDVSSDLSALIQGRAEVPTDVTPFDAASEVEIDQQRADAMVRIQGSLRRREAGQALALFRSAREVWPDRGEFGTTNISPEEEFMALREIFFANISSEPEIVEESQGSILEEEEGQEEEEVEMMASEQEFNLKEYLLRYAKPPILKAHVTLLADFEKNSNHTNHCVIKMLHRVGVDLELIGMLFQASLFRIFQKLLFSPLATSSHFQEMVKFAVHVVRQFVTVASKNEKIFMELLFWKTPTEAREIVEGYGSCESHVKQRWTEDQELELQRLFEEYRDVDDGRDAVDHIMDDITDREKTRGQIIRQLKVQGLIISAKDLKRKVASSRPGTWTEGQELELRDLFNTYRHSDDPVGNIVSNMEVKRSKGKVMEKILELELVEDRKELYKKRSGGRKNRAAEDSDSEDDIREYQEEPEFMETSQPFNQDSSDDEVRDGEEIGDNSSADGSDEPLEVLLDKVLSNGFKGQVGWIQKTLQRTAEARSKSDNPQPVPIVPLTEENEDAMEDTAFARFLKKIGLSCPANEQETFWRIPTDLSAKDLALISESLELTEEEKFAPLDKLTSFLQTKAKMTKAEISKGDKSAKKLKQKTTKTSQKTPNPMDKAKSKRKRKKHKAEEMEGFIASETTDDEEKSNANKRKKTQSVKKPSKRPVINDDSDNDDMELIKHTDKGKSKQSQRKPSKKHVINDDSDSDDMELIKHTDKGKNKQSRRKPSKKPVINEDSDSDDEEVKKNTNKRNNKQPSVRRPSKKPVINDSNDSPSEEVKKHTDTKKKQSAVRKSSKKSVVSDDDESDDEPLVLRSKGSNSNQTTSRVQSPWQDNSDDSDDNRLQMDLSEDDISSPNQQSSKRSRPTVLDDSDEGNSKDSPNLDGGVQAARKHHKVLLDDSDDDSRHLSDSKLAQRKQKSFVDCTDENSCSSLQNQDENGCSSQSNHDETSRLSVTNHDEKSRSSITNHDGNSCSSVTNHDENSHSSIVMDDGNSHATGQKSHKKKRKQRIDDSDDESSRSSHLSSNSSSSHHSKRQRLMESDSSSRDGARPDGNDSGCVVGATSATMADDSDEDTPLILYSQPTGEDSQGKKASLDTFPATLLTQEHSDSDSADDHIPLKRALKAQRIDSEED